MRPAIKPGNEEDQRGREEALVEAALELPPEDRSAFLERTCGDDPSLRQLVEGLLQVHRRIDGIRGPLPLQVMAAESVPPACVAEKPGDCIGRYKLLEQIGEGGCGVVYLAMQQEPVRRQVALKIIKPGMDTRKVLARFEAERQVLALMDHPNIAKVLDAGATETGRPYFVMELVRGISITEYCDRSQLSTDSRLHVFVQVCQAVQHAHQKGIIHRDIKPSNILVAYHDGVAIPKVIDFGIAKATTDQPLTDKTLFTAFEQFIGTPAYMSPEEAKLRGVDIDTRSDVYSLGVLLYELLTGQTPFETARLVNAGLDEVRRIIREEEPPRPSIRLNALDARTQTTIASRCQTEPQRLVHRIRGDLDCIVMKCLDKDRTRRYETANGLARDIERHLSNQPVMARPPSRLYDFRKTVRRHWVGCSAVAAVVVALSIGIVVSSLEALRARRAENLARQRLTDSEGISKFLTQVFQSPDPARDGRTVTVAESLGAAAQKLEKDLAGQPARRAKLQATLGETYYAMGLDPEAISLREKVRDYYLAAPQYPELIMALHSLANSYDRVGRREEALRLREQNLQLCRKFATPENGNTLGAMMSLAISYSGSGRVDEAIKLMEEVLPLYRKVKGPNHVVTLKAIGNLAGLQIIAGRQGKAMTLLQTELPQYRQVLGAQHPETLRAMYNLAICYLDLGRLDEALNLNVEVLDLERSILGPTHPQTLAAMANLAVSQMLVGRWEDALKTRQELLTLRRKAQGEQNPDTRNAMVYLLESYLALGRSHEAIALMSEICKIDPKDFLQALRLATCQAWFGPDADYQAARCHLVELAEKGEQYGSGEVAAKVYCLKPSTDLAALRRVLELAQNSVRIYYTNPWVYLALGMAQYRNGLYTAAEQTLVIVEQMGGCTDASGTARLFRVMCASRQGRTDEARELVHQVEAEMPPFPKDQSKPFADVNPKAHSHDLLIWWLAYKEAKAELHESTDSRVAHL